MDERVVKCCISQRIKVEGLLDLIDMWVEQISKAANRGSLVFNRLLLHCLQNNIPLPDLQDRPIYRQCFNVGVGQIRTEVKPVKKVYDTYFKDFPIDFKKRGNTYFAGITYAYDYSVTTYMTNFSNYLVYTFENRQKQYIREWCKKNSIEEYHKVRCLINGWTKRKIPTSLENFTVAVGESHRENYPDMTDEEVEERALVFWAIMTEEEKYQYVEQVKHENPIVQAFIKEQRDLLGNPVYVNVFWLKTSLNTLVKYYWALEPDCSKKHTVAPICKIKRHNLVIDKIILEQMLHTLEKSLDQNAKKKKNIVWAEIFKFPNRKEQYKDFLTTDGVTVSFHYLIPKKKAKPPVQTNVVAIDPGRSNLMYCVRDDQKTFSLNRHQYYNKTGMNKAKKKAKKWEDETEYGTLKSFSLKKPEDWEPYLKEYMRLYDSLWASKLKHKWSRQQFRVYSLKNSLLDCFFHSLGVYEKKKRPMTVAYGAGKFNPSGKHELSVPTTFLGKKCCSHYHTEFIDEFRTSITCNKCKGPLDKCTEKAVKKDGSVYTREVRGLRIITAKPL